MSRTAEAVLGLGPRAAESCGCFFSWRLSWWTIFSHTQLLSEDKHSGDLKPGRPRSPAEWRWDLCQPADGEAHLHGAAPLLRGSPCHQTGAGEAVAAAHRGRHPGPPTAPLQGEEHIAAFSPGRCISQLSPSCRHVQIPFEASAIPRQAAIVSFVPFPVLWNGTVIGKYREALEVCVNYI